MLLDGYLSPKTQHAIERQHERQLPRALRIKHHTNTELGMIIGNSTEEVLVSPKHHTNTKLCDNW